MQGSNSYTGATSITGGILKISGSLSSGSTVSVAGGTLQGPSTSLASSTVAGAITISNLSTSIIRPGTFGDNILNTGALTFSGANSTLTIDTATSSVSKIVASGSVALGGAKVVVNSGISSFGTYKIITSNGTMSGTLPSLVNNTGQQVVLQQTGNDLEVVVGATSTPSTPTNFNASSVATSTLTLSWSSSSGAAGYQLVGDNGFSTTTTVSTSINLTNLIPNASYNFNLFAYNNLGTSSSATLSTTTLPWAIPSQVSPAPVVSNLDSTTLNLSWTAPSNNGSTIDYYIINSSPSVTIATTSATTTYVMNLATSTSYTFSVAAHNAVGTGSFSASSTATTTLATTTKVSYVYNFESDTIGSVPANATPMLNTLAYVRNHTTQGNGLSVEGPATSSANTGVVDLNLFPSVSDYSVVWKETYTTAARSGFILRGGDTTTFAAASSTRNGYLFQVNSVATGVVGMRIYVLRDSGFTLIASSATPAGSGINVPRWYRATVNGANLIFDYSMDGINFINKFNIIDTTYNSGLTQYTLGYGNGYGPIYIDDITITTNATSYPVLSIPSATSTTATTTILNAIATDGGGSTMTVLGFNYGTTTAYGLSTSTTGSFSSGLYSQTISGLVCNTTYHVQAFAINPAGTGTSTDSTFTTSACPGDIITISSPVAYQVFQRNATNTADIIISGTYTGSPTAIEASFNGGAYSTISNSPTGGTYSGTLANQNSGQGTLTVRFSNATSTTATKSYVGIGDIYVIAGQSNFSGRGTSNQVYASPGSGVKAVMFGNNNVWQDLTDPVDSSTGQIDSVSSDTGMAAGSVFPLLATYILADQNVPVAFVPTAKGGSSATQWQPNANHKLASTLFGSMERRIDAAGGNIKTVIWYQGETDASGCTSYSSYTSLMNTIVNTIATDYPGVKTMIGQIAHNTVIASCMDTIRLAQSDLPLNNSNALPGAITYDIKLSDESGDTLHFKSNGDLSVFAQRWWNVISKNIYGNNINTSPLVDASNITYNNISNTVDIPFLIDLATSTAQSFTNNLAGTATLATSSVFSLNTTGGTPTISGVSLLSDNRTIRLTLSGATSTTLSVTYASGYTGVNNALYSTITGVPAIPFFTKSATILTIPDTPNSLTVSSVSTSTLTLSWTAVPGAEGYQLTGNNSFATTTTSATSTNLSNLTPNTLYNFNLSTYNSLGTSSSATLATTTLEWIVDNTNPIISSITPVVSTSSINISWTTDELASTLIEYGLTSSYGYLTVEKNTTPRTLNHTETLSGLVVCSTYHYRVKSTDSYSNQAISSDNTFTTSGCTGSATVLDQTASSIATSTGGISTLGGVTLDIPAGATTDNSVYQIKSLDSTAFISAAGAPDGVTVVGNYAFDLKSLTDIGTAITSFLQPITITLSYTDGDVSGFDESSLRIYRFDGSVWSALSSCVVNTNANTVTCNTSNFSVFSIFGTHIASGGSTGGRTHYGCKDPAALNYEYFAASNPALCKYETIPVILPIAVMPTVTSYNFTKDLKLGMTSNDVKNLQKFLNTKGYFITLSGLGSIGNESNYFGKSTQAALIKFQKTNGISPASGYFGAVTRNFIYKNISEASSKSISISQFIDLLLQVGIISTEKASVARQAIGL